MESKARLNMGCGSDIKDGFVNLDSAELDGVDVVHSLEEFPYPFDDDTFDEIIAINVLEHLDDTIRVMEEIWRISAPGAKVTIRVPFWNCMHSVTDPTHVKFFNQYTFDFFDPSNKRCQNRPYYTTARFRIDTVYYYIQLIKYFKIRNPLGKAMLNLASHYLNNIIMVLEFDLVALKK